jgi:hypothetical protein
MSYFINKIFQYYSNPFTTWFSLCNLLVSLLAISFINQNIEPTYLFLLARVWSRIAFRPIWRHYYVKKIIEYVKLKYSIFISCTTERRRCIDFNQPRFQIVIDQYVIAIQLKAMFITSDLILNALKRYVYEGIDILKALLTLIIASRLRQI